MHMELVPRLLDVIESDIVPLTAQGVSAGNKVFGAALLRKSDLSLVLAGTNAETRNPLFHGEINTLNQFYEIADRPATRDLLFLSTHEPCTLCMSAITWAGFDNYYYLFSHEDSRDSFAIPHDLRILKELFGLDRAAIDGPTRSGQRTGFVNLPMRSPNRAAVTCTIASRGLPGGIKSFRSGIRS
jgi:tRNA(Arg) A34 adenosine deaminase TadA